MRRFALLLPLIALGCMEGTKPEPLSRSSSLYKRLGGIDGIEKIVASFFAQVISDPKVKDEQKRAFREGDVAAAKRKTAENVAGVTGGRFPPPIPGPHGWLPGPLEADAVRNNLTRALDLADLPEADKKELLAVLLRQ